MTAPVPITLITGRRYRVTYKIDGVHRKPRVFVGTYLGATYDGQSAWNLRPAAGTSSLPADTIINSVMVDDTVPHSQPRIV